MQVPVVPTEKNQENAARAMAVHLQQPFLLMPPEAGYFLALTPERLQLCEANTQTGAVFVDFVGGAVGYRWRAGKEKKQLLARAVGLHKKSVPKVVDVTAGLGRDSFILASLGCSVVMVERSPILVALLQDGMRRALRHDQLAPIVRERLHLIAGEAKQYCEHLPKNAYPEVIYMDPMFPLREKSALVKKEMRFLQEIVLDTGDEFALLLIALRIAKQRVVVKRPRKGPDLSAPVSPSFRVIGKRNRFDVYLTR